MLISRRLKLKNVTPVNLVFVFCKPAPTVIKCALTNNGAHVNLIPARMDFTNQAIFAFRKFVVLASHKTVQLPVDPAHNYATLVAHNWVRASLPHVLPDIIYQMARVCRSSAFPANSTLAILQTAQALERVTPMEILILVASFPVAIKASINLTGHAWPNSVRRILKLLAAYRMEPVQEHVIRRVHN
jgi:hypothetical protein